FLQAFSILSKAKEEDDRKRQALLSFYAKAQDLLSKMDGPMLTLLQRHTKNVKEVLKWHEKQLKQTQYFLLVSGETSSGKSSLINLILGKDILPSSTATTTSTMCELKYGETPTMVVHFKDKDPETGETTKKIPLHKPNDQSTYLEQISTYVRQKGSMLKKVELFWPHELLQKGIVIIDSPGVGESDEMDEIVIKYLPEAFAFIYVANSTIAGGVKKDRLVKLLQSARDVSIEVPGEGKEDGNLSLDIQERLLSKCALFVCNKWDSVPEKDVPIVKKEVIEKLQRVWPGVDPDSQIIYMSTTKANKAQSLGVISKEFSSLMEGLRSLVLQSIEAKLELHWEWLYKLLSRIFIQAKVFVVNAAKSPQEIREKLGKIFNRLEAIQKDQGKEIKDLRESFREQVNSVVHQLLQHLLSDDIKKRFTKWSKEDAPDEDGSWKEVEENVNAALSSRFLEIVDQWEEENKVFSTTRTFLMEQFQDYFNNVEFKLQNVQSEAADDGSSNPNKVAFRIQISFWQKAVWNMKNFSLGLGRLLIKVRNLRLGAAIKSANELASNVVKILYKDLLKDVSKDILTDSMKKKLKAFVEDKLNDVKLYLDRIEARLQEMINADRQLYEQLSKRSARYQPLFYVAKQNRDQLAKFGLSEVCAVKIDREELEWKEETSSYLGCGSFGAVYQGKMKKDGEVKIVALKVWNEALDAANAKEIMEEIKNLRVLNHPHIVKFYGILLDKETSQMALVMERCKGNLKSHIFSGPESVPGKSENPAVFRDVRRCAKEITDGLAFMHAMGVVHRDLTLENILLTDENTVKIADVGLAKAEIDITGTYTGTPVYMAPEVFHSQVYGTKADIYSLGLLMWEMWYGQRAFADAPGTTLQALFDWIDRGNRPVDRQGCKQPPSFWDELMTECWDSSPEKRPTARECNQRIVEESVETTI
ncbi:unnamed protein product, partial [Porites evermanni]